MGMNLDKLIQNSGEWLNGRGPDSDIVISSRIRLARNIESYPFVNRALEREKKELFDIISNKVKKVHFQGIEGTNFSFWNLKSAAELDKTFLVERHLISKEHASGEGNRGVILDPKETLDRKSVV